MSVSLIIPAYNEERRIAPFLQSLADLATSRRSMITEIIVVNDGSTDATSEVVNQFRPKIPALSLIELRRNRGKGAAVQAGINAAHSDLVIFMDADGATPAEEIPGMITALQTSDIVIGNRWMKGSRTSRHSMLRRLSGWCYRTYMALFGLGAVDTMCGFKGYKRSVAANLFSDLIEKRWLFDTEIAYKAKQRGYHITNIPIAWESKDGSKLDTKTLINSALAIYPLIKKLNTLEKKLVKEHA